MNTKIAVNLALMSLAWSGVECYQQCTCSGSCHASGDPHITTFTDENYISSNLGTWNFYSAGSPTDPFEVEIHTAGTSTASWVDQVFVNGGLIADALDCPGTVYDYNSTEVQYTNLNGASLQNLTLTVNCVHSSQVNLPNNNRLDVYLQKQDIFPFNSSTAYNPFMYYEINSNNATGMCLGDGSMTGDFSNIVCACDEVLSLSPTATPTAKPTSNFATMECVAKCRSTSDPYIMNFDYYQHSVDQSDLSSQLSYPMYVYSDSSDSGNDMNFTVGVYEYSSGSDTQFWNTQAYYNGILIADYNDCTGKYLVPQTTHVSADGSAAFSYTIHCKYDSTKIKTPTNWRLDIYTNKTDFVVPGGSVPTGTDRMMDYEINSLQASGFCVPQNPDTSTSTDTDMLPICF